MGIRETSRDVDVDPEVDAVEARQHRFQILVDREARWTESRYWQDFAIGHTWIRLIDPEGGYDSWGYWPDLEGGHGVDTRRPWKSVPGRVRHPDDSHAPNAIHSFDVSAEVAAEVESAANAKEAAPGMYNLFTYNCTSFAVEMAGLAGVDAPSASTLGVANPNSIYSAIERHNADKGLDPMGRELAAGDGEQS